jgi:peptidoglycan/xylan/chitin deacetylase (PgdA/CDA1 family)
VIATQSPFSTTSLTPRQFLRLSAQASLYWIGASALCNKAYNRNGALILLYHSVPGPEAQTWVDPRYAVSPSTFESQMRFLAAHRHVISMTELVQALRRRDPVKRGSVVITFDDGYRDNLEVAAPILARYGLSATLYLPTGYVNREESQWIDRLFVMFKTRRKHKLVLNEQPSHMFDLRLRKNSLRAYLLAERMLLSSNWAEREDLLVAIEAQLCPERAPPRLTLNWNEVQQLVNRFHNFEIGVHTRNHIDLPAHDATTVLAELTQCVTDVEEAINKRATHFSFPYGRSDFETRELAKKAGFHSASVTHPSRTETSESDLFALPRLQCPSSYVQFRYWTS